MKHKKKSRREKDLPNPGSFRYGRMMKQNPIEFYHSRLEMLKQRREEKRKKKELERNEENS